MPLNALPTRVAVSYCGWKTRVPVLATLALAIFLPASLRAQSDEDRPTLKHQVSPMADAMEPEPEPGVELFHHPSTPLDELGLPRRGHAWALDHNGDAKQLTRLSFSPTRLNTHKAENYPKAFTGEYIFKQRATVDVPGPRASIRLHDGATTFYVQSLDADDDDFEEEPQDAAPRLKLVKLQVDGEHRVVNTFLFGRSPEKAKRSEDSVEITVQRVADSAWFKVVPTHPLEPGEYALIPLPTERTEFSKVILDFAIDPLDTEYQDVIHIPAGAP